MKLCYRPIIIAAIFIALLESCSAPKKVSYFYEAEQLPADVLANSQKYTETVLQTGDLLNITVSALNMASVAPFNRGKYLDEDGHLVITTSVATTTITPEAQPDYYLINTDGTIDFPVIGKIQAAGLTKEQLAQNITDDIYPRYIKEKPTVDIRLMNFTVVIGGAVKRPGMYWAKNERMNFLEAITMAGDLELQADRENILLYRTEADGSRSVHRLNIHDKDFLLSPYFQLQQNDYIYVEPNKSMKQSAWQLNPAVTSTLTILGGMSSLASLIVGILNLSKK